jgi:ABC-type dipeptide/oligopeptide/nickel transport system permease component
MLTFLGRRLFATIPVMAMVALFVFMILRLTPSDPAAILAGDYATTEQIENIREKLGLTSPCTSSSSSGSATWCRAISAKASSTSAPSPR